jgi:hypothetical protein
MKTGETEPMGHYWAGLPISLSVDESFDCELELDDAIDNLRIAMECELASRLLIQRAIASIEA